MHCWPKCLHVVSVTLWIFSLVELFKSDATNIALKKSSKQSNAHGQDRPERGNDGNSNTDYDEGSCVHGQPSPAYPLPWWQVDLEWMCHVTTVAITNRNASNAWRLHNFTIELYREDPTVHPNTKAQICAVYPGTVASGASVTLTCAPGVRGRYLRFQKNSVKFDDAVQFCELEAYGTNGTRSVFSRHPSQQMSGTSVVEKMGSPLSCGEDCHRMPCCAGFNFHGDSEGTCKFMSMDNGELAANASWSYFAKTVY
ncbi:fucolectin-like [Haliotis cracherodii]|uniref:fucolectin-like n=1 Tax=Haliotis cracherodii TaxID=6455 RepID=UPI0039E997D5